MMKTIIVTYCGEGFKYELEDSSVLLPVMFKSCRDFGVSPSNVIFRSWMGDQCSEDDIVSTLNDPIDGDLVNINMENKKFGGIIPEEEVLAEVINPVSVDMSFVSEGFQSSRNTSKWIRSRDTIASIVGELVLDGYFPFEVDVRLNNESILKTFDIEKEGDRKDEKFDYLQDNISKTDVRLIQDCNVSQGDSLQFVAKRVRNPLNSVQKEVKLSFGKAGSDPVLYRFYNSDTLSSVLGDLLVRGHFDVDVDIIKHRTSILRQLLVDNKLVDKDDGEFVPPLNDPLRGFISTVMMGDLDIDDGDCIFALGSGQGGRVVDASMQMMDDPIKVKITLEPGSQTVEKHIFPMDTISSVIGSIVTSDDFCWNIDLLRGEDSITENNSTIPTYQKRLIADCGVVDGDELNLALCMGGNDDAEDEEEEGETEEKQESKELKSFNVLIEGFIKATDKLQISMESSFAELIGQLALRGIFDHGFQIRRGNILIYDTDGDISYSANSSLVESGIKEGDLLRVNVIKRYKQKTNEPVYVPVAFNEHPVTILHVAISEDMTMVRMIDRLLTAGVITRVKGVQIGTLHGFGGKNTNVLPEDRRNLLKSFFVTRNNVLRIAGSLKYPDFSLANSNHDVLKRGATDDELSNPLKRQRNDNCAPEHVPVKLTIKSQQPEEPPKAKRDFYVVVHIANSITDLNVTVGLSEDEISVKTLKQAIDKELKIKVADQYMLWQTTCGTSGKSFYVEVWQTNQNRCWAHETTGEVLKHVNDNSETRIYHLHDDAKIKMPPNGKPLIRLRTAVEFYEFDKDGELTKDEEPNVLTNKSVLSWISGLLVRSDTQVNDRHFYMQASMGFVCTETGGQFTKATVRSTKTSADKKMVYFVALVKGGSKFPKYPFKPSTRIHMWARPKITPTLKLPEAIVECASTVEDEEKSSIWMIYRNRNNSLFEVALSQHFKNG